MYVHTQRLHSILDLAEEIVSSLDNLVDCWVSGDTSLNRQNVADKVTAETALLLWLASRLGMPRGIADQANRIAKSLVPYARTARHLEIMANAPQAVAGAAFAHVLLQDMGIRDERFAASVNSAFSSKFARAADRPNFRQLEFLWLEGLHTGARPAFEEAKAGSTILRPCNPIYMRREEAYAITHAAMYLTDFGRNSDETFIAASTISRFVDNCVAWCISTSDWDLLGEVLITAEVCHCGSSAYTSMAERLLEDLVTIHGVVPGPNYKVEEHQTRSGSDGRNYLLVHGYHSTFVYGILCCIRLVDADCDARAVLHDAASWLAFPCEYKAWLRGASSAPLLRKADQLQCEVLANAALISACREGRYVEVLERLERELPGSGESLSDTRHAATEHVLQAVRAATYDREPSSRHAALVSSL